MTENRELLDKTTPQDPDEAKRLLDEQIRVLTSICREFEDQVDTKLYQDLKSRKDRLEGIRAMYEE